MQIDPYAACPCGSGKKFKWCCQPIHAEVAQVFALDQQGQHEAALRAMDAVVAKHADNPEAWGRKALLLFQNEKPEEAEQALDKAFALFPTYPFGFFLKARFRLYEGELAGALMLLRRAAEAYDPDAREMLGQIYVEIFDCEMKLNHPIAARAAAEMAARVDPTNEGLRKGIPAVFGPDNPNLPLSARQPYHFKPLPASAPAEQRSQWDSALKAASTGKLSDAIAAFEQLTRTAAPDSAAWFNLALSRAWAGQNAAAVEALDSYVAAETDETQAAQGWALAEVLRFGQGMEEQADIVEHMIVFGLRDPREFVNALGDFEKEGLLAGVRVNEEEGVLSAILLQPPPPALTPELQAKQNFKPAAYLALITNFVRLWHTQKEPLDAAFQRLQAKLGNLIVEPQAVRGPAKFLEVMGEGVSFPGNPASKEEAQARMRESFEKFYEEVWINRPLKSLGHVAPIDAAGDPLRRKKLRGLLQFLHECRDITNYPYDFDRLERKLGLRAGEAPATGGPAGAIDIAALGAAELAALDANELDSAKLDQAYQAASKANARELAGKFAALLVQRPAYPERPDRFALFQFLINHAVNQGDLDAAFEHLNAGEADDCQNNEGRRRNEYELRRAQLHAKRGEFEDAERVYDSLIARVPTELDYRLSAAETMLSGRQGAKAAKYAKEGMAAAQKAKNRDLEGHFKELLAAAGK